MREGCKSSSLRPLIFTHSLFTHSLFTGSSMSIQGETRNMAVFCDFENIALGVREAKHDKFEIKEVPAGLLVKGSTVVKQAYCACDPYKALKAPMHQAAFATHEIP